MFKNKKLQKGFTLIEVITTVVLVSILAGFITLNLLSAKQSATLKTATETLLSDIKYAQIKSMSGDTEGRGVISTYGIHFNAGSYVLYHGVYASSDTSNYTVALDPSLSFSSITFPSSQVVLANGDGSVVGYSGTQNSVVLKDNTSNRQVLIKLNAYGVVTQAN